jgi:purine-binding chemotaxis protein CheW
MGAIILSASRQRAGEQEAVAQGRQYLTFTVAGVSYGIAISSVKEIIEYRAPTEVPLMLGYMRGLINMRGRVVPVIDLAVRFGRSRVEPTRRTCIVILEMQDKQEQHDIGVVADAVSAVVEIADADVEPAPSFGANLRTDFISGMGKIGDQFVILLDIGKVLSIAELTSLEAVREGPAMPAEAPSVRLAPPEAGGAPVS